MRSTTSVHSLLIHAIIIVSFIAIISATNAVSMDATAVATAAATINNNNKTRPASADYEYPDTVDPLIKQRKKPVQKETKQPADQQKVPAPTPPIEIPIHLKAYLSLREALNNTQVNHIREVPYGTTALVLFIAVGTYVALLITDTLLSAPFKLVIAWGAASIIVIIFLRALINA
ncbi:hypothetical protein HELRODRAFT_172564 [Helobdella robusta]|uniref:Uncharacterized protein n=1 Tax=Helobdella robusta TaxID=6412 RepID=T1F5I8_HELRO|nr:hypothetical protein HELRODRAFT_172564 [Helobdella robusta]ESO04214.1 hypothetical protein HELRODRAFT_172564 [Helobdella robusta]